MNMPRAQGFLTRFFKRKQTLQSIEFELVQLRLHLNYQLDLCEKVAKKVGVDLPKIDILKEHREYLNKALSDHENELLSSLFNHKSNKDES